MLSNILSWFRSPQQSIFSSKMIEILSSLLEDANFIILNENDATNNNSNTIVITETTRIKPIEISSMNLLVTGELDELSFSWCNDDRSYLSIRTDVQDVTVQINRLRLRIQFTNNISSSTTIFRPPGIQEDYLFRYFLNSMIQQVFCHHLQIRINDIDIIFYEPPDPEQNSKCQTRVVLQADCMELSIPSVHLNDIEITECFNDENNTNPSNEDNSILSNEMLLDWSVCSLRSFIHLPDEREIFLCYPFSYSSINNFGSQVLCHEQPLHIVVEREQLSILGGIFSKCLLVHVCHDDATTEYHSETEKEHNQKISDKLLSIIFPLPGLIIHTVNDTRLQMSGSTLLYQIDRKGACRLTGTGGGIQINENDFLTFEEDVTWWIDVANCIITLERLPTTTNRETEGSDDVRYSNSDIVESDGEADSRGSSIAQLHWLENEMKNIFISLAEINNILNDVLDHNKYRYSFVEKILMHWSIIVRGCVSLSLIGCNKEWAEGKIFSPKLIQKNDFMEDSLSPSITLDRFILGPCCFGDSFIILPQTEFKLTKDEVIFEDYIKLCLQSIEVARDIAFFLFRVQDLGRRSHEQISEIKPCFPCQFTIPGVDLSINKPYPINISLHDVQIITDSILKCQRCHSQLGSIDEKWLDISVHNISIEFAPGKDFLNSFQTGQLKIGPCSFGHFSMNIPSIMLDKNMQALMITGDVNVSLNTIYILKEIWQFTDQFIKELRWDLSITDTFCIKVPKLAADIANVKCQIIVRDICAEQSLIRCTNIQLKNDRGSQVSTSGIEVSYQPQLQAKIEIIDMVSVPHLFELTEPTSTVSLHFDQFNTLCINGHRASIVLMDDIFDLDGILEVAMPISLSFDYILMNDSLFDKSQTLFHDANLLLKPVNINRPFDTLERPGTSFGLIVKLVENKQLRIENCSLSGIIDKTNKNAISNFALDPGFVAVHATFSSIEWSSILRWNDECQTRLRLHLPFSQVASFSAIVSYHDKVVSTEAIIRVSSFSGKLNTMWADIMSWLTAKLLKEIFSFYRNTKLLGESAIDMSAKSVGRLALRANPLGNILGQVGGIFVADAIQKVVVLGKERRGASINDAWHISDLYFGFGRAVVTTARSGKMLRKDHEKSNVIGDVAVGTRVSLAKYVSENKSRLGAAGGAGTGMMVGALLLTSYGPFGYMAGSCIGGQIGAAIAKVKRKKKRKMCESRCNLSEIVADDWVFIDFTTSS